MISTSLCVSLLLVVGDDILFIKFEFLQHRSADSPLVLKKLSFTQSQSPSSSKKRKFETPGKSGSRKSSLTSPPSTSGVKNQRRSRILSAAGSSVQKVTFTV
jgi:hypothetical protein